MTIATSLYFLFGVEEKKQQNISKVKSGIQHSKFILARFASIYSAFTGSLFGESVWDDVSVAELMVRFSPGKLSVF